MRNPDRPDQAPASPETLEAVGASDRHTAMAHLYRGEMNRMTVWRQRLDVTSNWTILITIGLTTFTLGSVAVPHYTLLLGLALIGIALVIEARRYRHLHHSKWRIQLLERGYFSTILIPDETPSPAPWRQALCADLRRPRLRVDLLTSARARLRRNYLLLVYFVTAIWLTKVFIHPQSPATTAEFYARFAVGELIPPWFVVATASMFIVGSTLLAATCASQEQLEGWGRADEPETPQSLLTPE